MTYSEEVQLFIQNHYVEPARHRGERSFEVRAGDIHSKLGWTRRVPLVCSALSSQKLQRKVGVRLRGKEGPPSGQSPTVVFRYEILDKASEPEGRKASTNHGLMGMYGIAKEMYREVGGGEAFIRSQRENFGSIVPDDFLAADGDK